MIMQKGSHRLIHFQDSSSEEQNELSKSEQVVIKKEQQAINNNGNVNTPRATTKDKFQISQIQRGMFLYQNQDEDYNLKSKKQPQNNYKKQQKKLLDDKQRNQVKAKQANQINKLNNMLKFGQKDKFAQAEQDISEQFMFGFKDKKDFVEHSEQVTSKSLHKLLSATFSDDQDNQNRTTEDNPNIFKQQMGDNTNDIQKDETESQQGQKKSMDSTDQRMNQLNADKNKKQVNISAIQNIQIFVRNPIQSKFILKCILRRDTSGLNMFGPLYHMMSLGNMKTLLWSKKTAISSTSSYNFSMIQNSFGEVNRFNLGKIKSNFIGSHFNIYQNHYNQKTKVKRRQLRATVVYSSQILCNTPRKFQVYLVRENYSYLNLDGFTPQEQYSINDLYHIQSNKQKIELFTNRSPIWSEKLHGYILNFNGRINKPSIKNFILERPETKEEVLMFGKTGDSLYNIHISNPISPFMGLAIALTHFDNKFLCQ